MAHDDDDDDHYYTVRTVVNSKVDQSVLELVSRMMSAGIFESVYPTTCTFFSIYMIIQASY